MISRIKKHIESESFAGVLLIISALCGIIISNSNLYDYYIDISKIKISISIGSYSLEKTVLKWINNGLMTIFFLLLSLEIKYQITDGEFKLRDKILLPLTSAFSAAFFASLIYYIVNMNDPVALKGWAIPMSSDSAFVLAILKFCSNIIPHSAKVFIIGFSLIDDSISVFILALFYSDNINFVPLLFSIIFTLVLVILNFMNIKSITLYIFWGFLLWISVVESGISPTIAGVILGLLIPTRVENEELVKKTQDNISNLVTFIILPIFAFMNSEVPMKEITSECFGSGITIGIFLGLVLGKPCGILLSSYIFVKSGFASLPSKTNWSLFCSLAVLTGVGFTLNLFIGSLSFEEEILLNRMRLGIFCSAIFSGIIGCFLIKLNNNSKNP